MPKPTCVRDQSPKHPRFPDRRKSRATRHDDSQRRHLRRLLSRPESSGPNDILSLQRTVGNRATARFVQAKLHVGPTNDRYEREADRVARQVTAMRDVPSVTGAGLPTAQRQEEEEIQAKPLVSAITPLVQRQEQEEEEIQTKAPAAGGLALSPDVEARLTAQQGQGAPLPVGAQIGRAHV